MVSVIVPCYNCADVVSRALDSVFSQTYTDWELILVNNNSTDGTGALLKAYQEKYPDRVKTLMETKPGAPAARNRGLNEAKGEWIQFLDADDELMMDKLDRHLKLCVASNADMLAGAFLRDFRNSRKLVEPETDQVWLSLIKTKLGITSANFWKREKLLEVQGFNEALTSSQEYDLLFRLLANSSKLVFDQDASAVVYIIDNSVSRPKSSKQLKRILINWIELRNDIKNYLIAKGLFDDYLSIEYNKQVLNVLKWYLQSLNLFYILRLKYKYDIKGSLNYSIRKALRKAKSRFIDVKQSFSV